MKKNKKAQIEISFNWIFILLAGALILFFFIRIIDTQLTDTTRITHERAVQNLNLVLNALQKNPDSITTHDNINYQLRFYCDEGIHSYSVKDAIRKEELPHHLVFSPQIIGNSPLISWVRTFNAPFPISTVLYLTDEKTQYVFIENQERTTTPLTAVYYYNLFPESINKELTTLDNFLQEKDKGYAKYIVIIDSDEGIAEGSFAVQDSEKLKKIESVVQIKQTEIIFHDIKETRLTYLDPNHETTKKHDHFTTESIIGAIITGNPDLYECTMKKILEHIRIAAEINALRIKKIREAYPETSTCRIDFSPIIQAYFNNLATAAKNSNYEDLKDYSKIINNHNDELRRRCITIY